MSAYFDLVINCDLRENAPLACIEFVSWLCDANSNLASQPKSDCFDQNEKELANVWNFPFLAPQLEEETISNFQSRYRYTMPESTGERDVRKYSLHFFERNILDDTFFDCHLSFLYWIAGICENGFIGYYKEEFDAEPTLMYVKEGKLITLPENQ
jgi:hypothetical protein